jgi:hypothetical protein
MPRYAEVHHSQWIDAPLETVRAQALDLDHHIVADVHPKLRFRVLSREAGVERYEQRVRLLGILQRDVFERRVHADGSIHDVSVEGFNKGGSLHFRFRRETLRGRPGTRLEIEIRLPLPPLVGGLLKPLIEAQIRREVATTALQDRDDIERRGYPRAVAQRAAVATPWG